MMRKPLLLLALLLPLALPARAQSPALFTGLTRLACEALLCLSSGSHPAACTPSLTYYFSLHKQFRTDLSTLTKRLNFLNLCPSASADTHMQSLTQAIARGAGYCDAASLNRNTYETTIRVCPTRPRGSPWWRQVDEEECSYQTVQAIDPHMPHHCSSYYQHGYIAPGDLKPPRYVGQPGHDGRWQAAPGP